MKKWTPTMIEEHFEEAVQTLERLELQNVKPRQYFNAWPDIVYTKWEIIHQAKKKSRLGPPTPSAITRMEKTFGWLNDLTVEERHLIWWRAEKVYWDTICDIMKCCRQTAWRKWVYALSKIAFKLNALQRQGD